MDRFQTIQARYGGRCAECEDRIEAGDTVVFDTEERKTYCQSCGGDLTE